MGLPNINISFRTQASTVIARSQKGIVAMLLKDTAANGGHILKTVSEIPSTLSVDNQDCIKRAFLGAVNKPYRVIVFVLPNDATELTAGLTYMETQKFDYLAGTPDITSDQAEAVVEWVKNQRENGRMAKAVLPNSTADHEAIVNFVTEGIVVGAKTLTAAAFCSRIAGLLAGTPLDASCAFQALPEVTDVERLSKTSMDAAVEAGKLLIFHDGEKVKVGGAVNSLTTVTAQKGEEFKKIKIVEAMDIIKTDIKRVAEDTYIGRYANSYDNKCLLISAIQEYFSRMEVDSILQKGGSFVGIDLAVQEEYLYNKGFPTSDMSELEIKTANTGDRVFLSAEISILDAIEQITLDVIL